MNISQTLKVRNAHVRYDVLYTDESYQTGLEFLHTLLSCVSSAAPPIGILWEFHSVGPWNEFNCGCLKLPPGRNTDYLSAIEGLTIDVTNSAKIINIFPNIIKP